MSDAEKLKNRVFGLRRVSGERSQSGGRFGLRWILLIYVVAPLAVVMAVAGYLILQVWERNVEERMQSDLEMVARAVRLPLSHAMERRREGGIEQALESALSTDSVYSAYAFDLEGEQIASAGGPLFGTDLDRAERDKVSELAVEGRQSGEFGEIGDRRVYSYFVPLSDSRNRASGLLQLTRREKDFRDDRAQARRVGIIGFVLATLVMALLVLIGQYGAMERHFRNLVDGMRRVAGGDVGHRLAPAGPREIASISASFNEMLDSIQEAEREIQKNREARLAMEQRLRMQEKLAAVGQLAAGVAHELGTPLGTVSGAAQRELRRVPPDSTQAAALEKIRHEVHRMEVIIRQLLDFSHSRQLQIRNVRPEKLAASAVSAVRDEAARHGAEMELAGNPELPAIAADPIALEQVLVNLLRNAVQSAPGVRVCLGWESREKEFVFTVEDSGPGIPDDIRPRLFEPFFTTKNVGSGTGLGLAVVHGIIDDHGGQVRIGASALGGTRVDVSLPLDNAQSKHSEHS